MVFVDWRLRFGNSRLELAKALDILQKLLYRHRRGNEQLAILAD